MAAVDYDKNADFEQEFLADEYSISQDDKQNLLRAYEASKNGTLKTISFDEMKARLDKKYGK